MTGREAGFVVNDKYKAWIETMESKIKHSQIKVFVKMNYEMLDLYWDIDRDIVVKQKHAKWDDASLTTIGGGLKETLPSMLGLSVQSLKSTRYWYRFYNPDKDGLQAVSQFVV